MEQGRHVAQDERKYEVGMVSGRGWRNRVGHDQLGNLYIEGEGKHRVGLNSKGIPVQEGETRLGRHIIRGGCGSSQGCTEFMGQGCERG